MKKNIFVACLMIILSGASVLAQDNLLFEAGDGLGGFVDVDLLTPLANNITWAQDETQQNIRVTAVFSGAGTPKTRELVVTIPRGLRITAYSANSSTPDIAGVSKIGFSSTDDPLVVSSTLVGYDGVTPWPDQQFSNYSASSGDGTVNTARRLYEGKIQYVFNTNCDRIVLTFTMQPDQEIIGRDNASTRKLSEDITVDMTSGGVTLNKNLRVTVSNLPYPLYFGNLVEYPNRRVEGIVNNINPNTGTTPVFATGKCIWSAIGSVGKHFYAEQVTVTCGYPEGVTFEGIKISGITSIDHSSDPSAISLPHVTVTNNTTTRIVTVTVTNCLLAHAAQVLCYWSAVIDDSVLKWGDSRTFPMNSTIVSGGLINDPKTVTLAQNSTTITFASPEINVLIVPRNATRRDLNDQGDFPLDYTLGAFSLYNIGPSVPKKIKYKFEFPSSPQIRMVMIPVGDSSSETFATDCQIKVTGHTSLGRSLNLSLTLAANGLITTTMLGLASNEYLTDMIVEQQTLTVHNYTVSYASTSASHLAVIYHGRFVGGQEGDVKLTVTDSLDVPLTSRFDTNGTTPLSPPRNAIATDHTTIGWDNVFYNYAASGNARHNSYTGTAGGTFYPGEKIYFSFGSGTGTGSADFAHQNDKIDPDMYINLPEGLHLDESTLVALSTRGANGNAWFPLNIVSTQTKIINGVEWTSYKIKTTNHTDIVTWESIPQVYKTGFTVRFTVNISTASQAFSAIQPASVFFYDAGKTGTNGAGDQADVNNWTGKGTNYYVASYDYLSTSFNVVQKPGLNVYLGIKVAGDPGDYYTYDETPSSIAMVTRDLPAELWLQWENTSTDEYYVGSEIYLPIPKKNLVYDHYFSNVELANPQGTEPSPTNSTPQWSAYILSQVSLPLFDTYYGISTSGLTNYSSAGTTTWTPVSTTFYDYPSLLALYSGDATAALNAVTMLKFVANTNIPSAGTGAGGTNPTGETTFQMDVDENAQLGERDFWRSYQKGWRTAAGDGTWIYGSVVAAEPAMSGVRGRVFYDSDQNGTMCGDETYNEGTLAPLSNMHAVLTGTGMSPLNIVINSDGSYRSLHPNGQVYYLKTGSYVLTIYNDDYNTRRFSNKTSPIASYHLGAPYPDGEDYWYMDIQQNNIAANHSYATYPFTVVSSDITTRFVGVGMKDPQNYIAVNPQVRVNILSAAPEIGCAPIAPSSQTLCSGGAVVGDLQPNGTGYKWYDSSHTLLTTTTPVTAGTYYVTRTAGLIESPETAVTVSIATTPTVNAISNISGTVGTAISAINFSGTNATSFDWTITGDNIGGIAAGGTGSSIPAFTPTATGTVTITVIPKNGTCAGTSTSFTITVTSGTGPSVGAISCPL